MKNILVLAWTLDDAPVFEVAAQFAKSFASRVVGYGPPSIRTVDVTFADAGMGAALHLPLVDSEEIRKQIEALRQAFSDRMKAAGVIVDGADTANAAISTWHEEGSSTPSDVGRSGRVFDMLVVPQPGGPPKMPTSFFEDALFESGRPVLMVPARAYTAPVGKRVVIAWNASTESARAVAMAMPLLRRAEAIDIVSVEGAMVQGPAGEELAESLRRHGLPVTSRHCPASSVAAGQTILNQVTEFGGDMIVKGAYTQSRLRQMVFGGVTRDLIQSSPVPVLFSH